MPEQADRIKAKITGRQCAQEVLELFFQKDEPWMRDGVGADFAEGMLRELRKRTPQRAIDAPQPEKPIPIARLGAELLDFGQYSGDRFDDIPLDYLHWLLGRHEDLTKKLRAYLTHPELEARRGAQ